MSYDRLFAPLNIGGKLTLPNRLVMAPMTTASGRLDGSFSDEEITYLSQRAAGGIGLIMTPACYVHPSGQAFERQVGCHHDAMMVGLARCAKEIGRHGAASFLQLHHGGNAAKAALTGKAPLAPSAVINRRGTSELPTAMTDGEIWMIIEAFARSAARACEAGFTGIELHGANTYLFQQFFSPFTNQRTDLWGGDLRCDRCDQHAGHDALTTCHRLTNRARFAAEVIKAVRREVGAEYPICYRISPEEPQPDGYSAYEAVELLRLIVPLGIDIVHVSSWEYGAGLYTHYPEGSHPSTLVREAIDRPVIGVGKILHPDQAMRVLDDGLELVALGRGLLLNPDWARLVQRGNLDQIRTRLRSEEERQALEIPEPMKAYTRNSMAIEPR